MLAALDLSPDCGRVYADLIISGGAGPGTVADRIGLPRENVRRMLDELADKGLVTRLADGTAYVAVSPAVALDALLAARRQELAQAEREVAVFLRAHPASEPTYPDLVQMIVGADNVRSWFAHMHRAAQGEVLAMIDAHPTVRRAGEERAEDAAVERGVGYRVLLERAALDDPDSLAGVLAGDQQVRITSTVPIKMIIVDRASALVPMRTEPDAGQPAALLVRAPGLLAALVALFEASWERALPVPVPAGPARPETEGATPEALDLRILALLLAGSTDSAVAGQLGLGVRTVRRRIAALMHLTQVDTRLQLGWQACQRGWFSE